MKAFVADQSGLFGSIAIQPVGAVETNEGFTVVGALPLDPGSYVVFANIALAAEAAGDVNIEAAFLLGGSIYGEPMKDIVVGDANSFLVIPLTTGLVLDKPNTLRVGCVATAIGVASQPTTIAAIQVESVTRITNQQL